MEQYTKYEKALYELSKASGNGFVDWDEYTNIDVLIEALVIANKSLTNNKTTEIPHKGKVK